MRWWASPLEITVKTPNHRIMMNGNLVSRIFVRLALALVLALVSLLLGTEPSHAAASVTLAPATALPNQAVSVTGAGFTAGAGVTIASISLGGVVLPNSKINAGSGNAIQVDSAGNFVAIVLVPITGATLAAGGLALLVTDSMGASSSASLTIPAPALTVTPAAGRAATDVTVNGSNYPVNSSRVGSDCPPAVDIYYENFGALTSKLLATVVPASTGKFSAALKVPVGAKVGVTNKFYARTVGGPESGPTATHSVPAPKLSISPTSGAPDATVTVTGVDFPAYTPVRDLAFAHVGLLSATAASTNSEGVVTLTVKIPLLEDGAYPVRLQVWDNTCITAFTIVGSWFTLPPPPAPEPLFAVAAEALAPLQTNLVRVWNLDNATKNWSFYDPDPDPAFASLGSLDKLVDGRVYWMRLVTDQTVVLNGKERALFQGWNLIPW